MNPTYEEKAQQGAEPSHEQINRLVGHYQSGSLLEAEKLATSLTKKFPTYPVAWTVLGAVLGQTGRLNESVGPLRVCVELSPHDADAHFNLGNALKALGKLGESEASYRQAVLLKPDFAEALYNMGNTLKELGRFDEAEASYRQSIAVRPSYAEAHSNLGSTIKELGRLDEAETVYRQAIALRPDFAEACVNLGVVLEELHRSEEAEAAYEQAIALKPDYAEAFYGLGNVLTERGSLEKAVASYRQATVLKPDYADAHCNLGIALFELGSLNEAEECYTQAIACKPDLVKALTNRSYLLFHRGAYEAALSDADTCNLPDNKKELPFISLYALGRISEIYERLEVESRGNTENISLAAFSAFISHVESKPTANQFCPDPLDFISTANLSSHLGTASAFVIDLIDELSSIEALWEPKGKATVGGFQSLPSVNLFENPTGKLRQLREIIIEEIEAYVLKFQDEPCSFIEKFPTARNLSGWSVRLKQNGHQDAHIHPSGWLSGVIYLKVVSSQGRNEGAIEFSLNGKHYCSDSAPRFIFQPEVGDIVLFPSSLHHKTIPFNTNEERIIVSFDLKPRL